VRSWRRLRVACALAAALLGPAGAALAQVVVMEPIGAYYDWTYGAGFASSWQPGASIDGGGSFDVLRFRGHVSGGGPLSQNVRVFMDAAYAHTRYDFGQPLTTGCASPAACFRGSPWRDVHTVDVAPGASLVLGDAVHVQAVVPIRWQAESGGSRTGVTAGIVGLLGIRLSDAFTISGGIGVQSEIADSTRVSPVIALDWLITPGLRLVTRGGPYQGGLADLLLGPEEGAVQLRLSSGWVRQRFRLDDAPPNPGGVGQYTAVPVLAGFRIHLGPQAFLDFEGGVALDGHLRVEGPAGVTLRNEGFDTAGLLRGALRVSF